MKVRGHTLVWGLPLSAANPFGGWTPTPAWVHGGDLSRDAAIRVMTGHIESVMTQYRGRIREWVVVNEALGETAVDGMKLDLRPKAPAFIRRVLFLHSALLMGWHARRAWSPQVAQARGAHLRACLLSGPSVA